MSEPLLDVTEASKVLGVPRSWIYMSCEAPEGDLPYFKIGRYLRFRESELLAYLETNRGR